MPTLLQRRESKAQPHTELTIHLVARRCKNLARQVVSPRPTRPQYCGGHSFSRAVGFSRCYILVSVASRIHPRTARFYIFHSAFALSGIQAKKPPHSRWPSPSRSPSPSPQPAALRACPRRAAFRPPARARSAQVRSVAAGRWSPRGPARPLTRCLYAPGAFFAPFFKLRARHRRRRRNHRQSAALSCRFDPPRPRRTASPSPAPPARPPARRSHRPRLLPASAARVSRPSSTGSARDPRRSVVAPARRVSQLPTCPPARAEGEEGAPRLLLLLRSRPVSDRSLEPPAARTATGEPRGRRRTRAQGARAECRPRGEEARAARAWCRPPASRRAALGAANRPSSIPEGDPVSRPRRSAQPKQHHRPGVLLSAAPAGATAVRVGPPTPSPAAARDH